MRQEICEYYNKKGVPTTPNQIVVTSGSMLSMFSLMMIILRPGDECLIPFPGFPNYFQTTTMLHAKAVPYVTDMSSNYLPTIESLEKLITPKTKCMILCNPGNPTGALFPENLVREIVELTKERNIFLISDEVYGDITFDSSHHSAAKYCSNSDSTDSHIAVCAGVSKSEFCSLILTDTLISLAS